MVNDINNVARREEEKLARLQMSRARHRFSLQKSTSNAAAKVTGKLEEMIARGNDKTALFVVLALAALKDGGLDIILDFLFIGLLPIIGQIPGYFISAVLFALMWGKGMLKGRIFAWVLSFFVADSLPFVEELPLTVTAVLFAWHGLVKKVREMEEQKKRIGKMSQEEIEQIEENYEV